MTVVNINHAKLQNAEKFSDYVSHASKLMSEQGVKVICRGKYASTMRGQDSGDRIVAIFEFESHDAVKAFYECETYKKLIPLRDEACDMTITLYDAI